MTFSSPDKPVAIWLDDWVFKNRRPYGYSIQQVEEEVDHEFEIRLFGSPDDAIDFVVQNINRIFMFVQDSTRPDKGKIIPAWKKLRPRESPSIGYESNQGDFCTYVIDAFTPLAGSVFAGNSFHSKERAFIERWSMHDSRVLIADKLGFTSSRLTEGKKSPFATIGAAQLERWRSSQTQQTISTENTFLRPLAEELAVLCGAKPHLIDSLTHRKFEELIASLFHNHEFDVHLTAATRDGGYDIVAVSHTGLLKETILVEVKHFAPNRPVGVGIVRALYGVKSLHGASKAILATSSYVSRDACHEFSRVIPWEIDFVNREQILSWCEDYLEVLLKNEDDQETEPG